MRDVAAKFLSFYDCTFMVSITLLRKSRPETIHLLNHLKTYSRTYLYHKTSHILFAFHMMTLQSLFDWGNLLWGDFLVTNSPNGDPPLNMWNQ